MWTRARLKENGKKLFLKSYWPCVAVCFLSALLGGGRGGVSFNFSLPTIRVDFDSMTRREAKIVAGVALLIFIICMIIIVFAVFFSVFVGNVMMVGSAGFFIENRTRDISGGESVSLLFSFFKSGRYSNVVKTMFFMRLYIFLWSLLLVVPGIIKYYEYYMVPYILAENPLMNDRDVFAISKRMMEGQKWDTFVLELSFIGWNILSLLTIGILSIFYVNPYFNATCTELYIFSKTKAYSEGYIRQ